VLALGEQPAGILTDIARAEFGISQPAVSQHLKVLRENGFATVRADGARRLYALDSAGPDAAERALAALRAPLSQRLDALHTEVARGRRATAKSATFEGPRPQHPEPQHPEPQRREPQHPGAQYPESRSAS
jgi:DNA-binding transcriptional ArsR family regulator